MDLAELIAEVVAARDLAWEELATARHNVGVVGSNTPAGEGAERNLRLAERAVEEEKSSLAWQRWNHLEVALMLLTDAKNHLAAVDG